MTLEPADHDAAGGIAREDPGAAAEPATERMMLPMGIKRTLLSAQPSA